MIRQFVYSILRFLPIKNNRVLFIGYYGSQYGCNPKYVSEYLITHHQKDVEVVWAFTQPNKHNIDGVRKVRLGSVLYLLMLATSHFILTNYRMTPDFKKRRKQIYIQTWHSSLRLKKIEKDTEDTLPLDYLKMAKNDSKQIDYVVAGCQISHNTFANSFWYAGKILDVGTPRNDMLLFPDKEKVGKIKSQLKIDERKSIVLYAPTFRNDKSVSCYNIEFERLRKALHEKFGHEWVVLVRLHPHMINYHLFDNDSEIIDVTSYDDIQELLVISDVLITDYSSLMFDFAISGKPIFLYASDLEHYCQKERNLYFDVKDLPFPLAQDNDNLIANIQSFETKDYKDKIDRFNAQTGSYEQGTASAAIAKLIMENIKQ